MIQFISAIVLLIGFSKSEYFQVLESKDKTTVLSMEKKLTSTPASAEQKAYLGTIIMKAADFESSPMDKLQKFKEGKALLESAITANPNNVEFRFLRLVIQEHAPKLLKYNTNISSDAAFIKQNVDKAIKEVKSAITNYATSSANLKL